MTLLEMVRILEDEAYAKRGLTTNKLADKAGLCHQTVYNLLWEITKFPRFNTVMRIARALDFDLELRNKKLKIHRKPVKRKAA